MRRRSTAPARFSELTSSSVVLGQGRNAVAPRAADQTIAKGVHVILTTGPAVEGRPVERYLDLVTAQAIMGVHIGKDITAGLRNIVGGRSKSYEGEVVKAVAEVIEELKAGGERLGADAILSIDLDYETVGDNMLMVAASGTAVKLS